MTTKKHPWNWMSQAPLGSLANTNDNPIESLPDIGEQRRNLLSDFKSGHITQSELSEGLKKL